MTTTQTGSFGSHFTLRGMSGSGRSYSFATTQGCDPVLAVNGKFLLNLGPGRLIPNKIQLTDWQPEADIAAFTRIDTDQLPEHQKMI